MRRCVAVLTLAAVSGVAAAAQEVVLTIDGPTPFANYGWSLAAAGDVDQDAVGDLLIGALQAFPAQQYPGGAFLHSGRTGALLASWSGPNIGSEFGQSVSSGGDVDQDGTNDVLIGAPSFLNPQAGLANHGLVRLQSGATTSTLFAFEGDSSGDSLGSSVAIVGDADGDGFVDLLAGAPEDDDFGSASGSVRLWSGANGGTLFTVHGQQGGGFYGATVAPAGDFDQNGFDDLFVGAWGHGPALTGLARVLSGLNGAPLQTWLGASNDDQLGYALARLGDVSGDGLPDLAIGAPGADVAAPDDGRVLVVSGAGGQTLFQLHGAASGAALGGSLAGLDADGDGVSDLLVGGSGAVTLFSGQSQTPLQTFPAPPTTLFGHAIAGVGDLDGDGYDDAAVGAAAADPGGTSDAGTVTVFGGCPSVQPYGEGCPGSGGFTPSIRFDVCPAAGSATTFRIEGGLGGAPSVILVGAGTGSVPAGGGCELLVLPLVTQIVLPLGGAGPGAGVVAFPVGIPAAVAGSSATVQVFVGDGGVPVGFSTSGGLALDF